MFKITQQIVVERVKESESHLRGPGLGSLLERDLIGFHSSLSDLRCGCVPARSPVPGRQQPNLGLASCVVGLEKENTAGKSA